MPLAGAVWEEGDGCAMAKLVSKVVKAMANATVRGKRKRGR